MLRTALLMMLSAGLAVGSAGQGLDNRFDLEPGLVRSDDATSIGFNWDLQLGTRGTFRHDRFPRRLQAAASSRGAVALDPDANREAMEAALSAGWFVALFEPAVDLDPTDPEAAPVGGFDYGSVYASAAGGIESNQTFDEVNGKLGARLAYVVSRQDYPWPLVPAVQAEFAAVLPAATDHDRRLDTHARLELEAAWHLPVHPTPFVVHADVRYWTTGGLPDHVEAVRSRRGAAGSAAVGYRMGAAVGDVVLHEVFVRWSAGEAPVRADERRTITIGLVVGP